MVVATQHDPIGVHKIIERRAFAREFGATDHIKGHWLRLAMRDNISHPITGPHRHRALVDDDQIVIHILRHRLGGHAHILEIGFTVDTARGANTDKDIFSIGQRFGIAGGKVHPPSLDIALDHFTQARLKDRDLAVLQHLNFFFTDIDKGDPIAHIGKTGATGEANIARPCYRDIFHLRDS